jgi:hypothetical protein
MFAEYRCAHGDEEEEDEEENLDDLNNSDIEDYKPRRRHSYPREYKLAAVEYFETTWMKGKDGEPVKISLRKATRKLKIDRKTLRQWICNKQKILNQKKGSRRAWNTWNKGKEHEMEVLLNKEFEKAQEQGQKISDRWLLRHAREIYGQLYPERVIKGQNDRWKYLGFRFSKGWF